MFHRRTLLLASTVLAAWIAAGATGLQAQPNLKPFAARILPDNKRVVVAGEDGALALFTLPDLTVVRRFTGDPGKIKYVAVSTDGKWVAASYDKGKLWIFDVETGEAKHQIANAELKPGPLMFTPQGRLLVLSNTNKLMQFDAVTAALIGTPMEIRGGMWRHALSADGKYLAVVGFEEVYVYDVVDNKEVMGHVSWKSAPELRSFEKGYDAQPVFVGFRSDGRVVIGLAFVARMSMGGPGLPSGGPSALEGRMVTVNPSQPLPLEVTTKELVPLINAKVYSDGKILAVSNTSASLWSLDDATAATPWETADPGKNRVLDGADLSADRVWVVGVSKRSGEIEVWDTRTLERKVKKLFGIPLSWQQPTLVKMVKMP